MTGKKKNKTSFFSVKRAQLFVFLVGAMCLFTSCFGDKEFKITGNTKDGRDLTFRVVSYSPEGVKTDVLATRSGYFEYTGKAPDNDKPVFVEFYTNDYTLLGVAEVIEGKTTDVKLDRKGIKGFVASTEGDNDPKSFNRTLKNWLSTVKKIDNSVIEKFIKENPQSAVSLALLSTLYDSSSDPGKAYALLAKISPEGRPGYYNNGFTELVLPIADAPKEAVEVRGFSNADSVMTVTPKKYKATFIAFTGDGKLRSDSVVPALRRLSVNARSAKKLVLEHNLSNDTVTWKRSLRDDATKRVTVNRDEEGRETTKIETVNNPVTWVSIWSGPGPSAPGANSYPITQSPYFVVADSAARVVYSGVSVSAAEKAYNKLK